jgi:hypothetical protein
VTSIGHVDVWVDTGSGLPVKVAVYGRTGGPAALTSTFLDLDVRRPTGSVVAFYPPAGARVRFEQTPDLAAAMDRFTPFLPPEQLAGLARRERVEGLGAVGTYGRGVTVLTAVPMPGRLSGELADQLGASPGAARTPEGIRLAVGPVALLLTAAVIDGRTWLLAGTVTPATLTGAARDLAAHPPGTR